MVQPVDIVDSLSKTELVRKLNHQIKTNPEMEQLQATKTFKEKTSDEAQRTKESIKSDMLIISQEQQEQEKKKKDKKKKDKKKKEASDSQDENDTEKSDEQHLDLKA